MCTSTWFSGPASDQLGSCTVLPLVSVELGAQTALELATFPPSRGGRYRCTHAPLPSSCYLPLFAISSRHCSSPPQNCSSKGPKHQIQLHA